MVHPAVNAFNKVGVAVNPGFEYGEKHIQPMIFLFSAHGFQPSHSLRKSLYIALTVGKQYRTLQNEGYVLHGQFHISRHETQVDLDGLFGLEETRAAFDLLYFLRGKELDGKVLFYELAFLEGG